MTGLTQDVLNIIFSKYMVILSPMILLLMSVLFADRLVDLVHKAVSQRNRRWN